MRVLKMRIQMTLSEAEDAELKERSAEPLLHALHSDLSTTSQCIFLMNSGIPQTFPQTLVPNRSKLANARDVVYYGCRVLRKRNNTNAKPIISHENRLLRRAEQFPPYQASPLYDSVNSSIQS